MCIRQVEIERERCKCVSLGMRGNRECVWSLTDHDVKAQTSQHQLATETQEAQAHLMSSITPPTRTPDDLNNTPKVVDDLNNTPISAPARLMI